MIVGQGADLRVYVELRGFEPLTPSMRTQCSTGEKGLITVSAQVRDLRMVTLTASDVAWPSLAAPILLPKSDSRAGPAQPALTITTPDCASGLSPPR
jgi:hypothetical protein